MAVSLNFVTGVGIATDGTSVSGVAAVDTVRLGYFCLVVVAVSLNLVIGVGVATDGTSVGGVTAIDTVRLGYFCLVVVLADQFCATVVGTRLLALCPLVSIGVSSHGVNAGFLIIPDTAVKAFCCQDLCVLQASICSVDDVGCSHGNITIAGEAGCTSYSEGSAAQHIDGALLTHKQSGALDGSIGQGCDGGFSLFFEPLEIVTNDLCILNGQSTAGCVDVVIAGVVVSLHDQMVGAIADHVDVCADPGISLEAQVAAFVTVDDQVTADVGHVQIHIAVDVAYAVAGELGIAVQFKLGVLCEGNAIEVVHTAGRAGVILQGHTLCGGQGHITQGGFVKVVLQSDSSSLQNQDGCAGVVLSHQSICYIGVVNNRTICLGNLGACQGITAIDTDTGLSVILMGQLVDGVGFGRQHFVTSDTTNYHIVGAGSLTGSIFQVFLICFAGDMLIVITVGLFTTVDTVVIFVELVILLAALIGNCVGRAADGTICGLGAVSQTGSVAIGGVRTVYMLGANNGVATVGASTLAGFNIEAVVVVLDRICTVLIPQTLQLKILDYSQAFCCGQSAAFHQLDGAGKGLLVLVQGDSSGDFCACCVSILDHIYGLAILGCFQSGLQGAIGGVGAAVQDSCLAGHVCSGVGVDLNTVSDGNVDLGCHSQGIQYRTAVDGHHGDDRILVVVGNLRSAALDHSAIVDGQYRGIACAGDVEVAASRACGAVLDSGIVNDHMAVHSSNVAAVSCLAAIEHSVAANNDLCAIIAVCSIDICAVLTAGVGQCSPGTAINGDGVIGTGEAEVTATAFFTVGTTGNGTVGKGQCRTGRINVTATAGRKGILTAGDGGVVKRTAAAACIDATTTVVVGTTGDGSIVNINDGAA